MTPSDSFIVRNARDGMYSDRINKCDVMQCNVVQCNVAM